MREGFWCVAIMTAVCFTLLNTARTFLSDRIMFDVFISILGGVCTAIALAHLVFVLKLPKPEISSLSSQAHLRVKG